MATIPDDVIDLVLNGGEQLAQQLATAVPTQVLDLVPASGEAIIIRRVLITNFNFASGRPALYHDRDGTVTDLSTLVFNQQIPGVGTANTSTDVLQTDVLISSPFESISISSNANPNMNFTFYGSRLQT